MKYPMNFELTAAELVDMCDKSPDDMDTCDHCILYRMCCWYLVQEIWENDEQLKEN